jgi:hypothetical protein
LNGFSFRFVAQFAEQGKEPFFLLSFTIRSRLSSVIFRWVAWGVASMKCSSGRLCR